MKAIQKLGFRAVVWDIAASESFDLSQPSVVRRLCKSMHRREMLGLMVATPCTSWTIARNPTNVIRSVVQPWGTDYPTKPLSQNDETSLFSGNILLQNTLVILRLAVRLGIPFVFEHPASSYAFQTPELQRIMNRKDVETVVVDQCSFGCRYRKRTKLLVFGCCQHTAAQLATCQCHGRGICDFTAKPHIHLQGRSARLAQEYPKKLATYLAKLLVHRARDRRIDNNKILFEPRGQPKT